MMDRCMCGYPPIILVHLSVSARAFSIILSAGHHQQNNIMLWINQSLIYVLSEKIQNGIDIGFLLPNSIYLLGLCTIQSCLIDSLKNTQRLKIDPYLIWLICFWIVLAHILHIIFVSHTSHGVSVKFFKQV